jgi:hypothetical protein
MAEGTSVLIVVGRDQTELFAYFRWGFGQSVGVEVVLDRRLGERRGRRNGHEPAQERRKGDRRRTTGGRAELLARGFLIVRRSQDSGARDREALR